MKISEANRLRILYFLSFCGTASWMPIMAKFLSDNGIHGLQTSLVLNITPLMMFLVQPVYGMLADRYGYKICLLLATALGSISYLGYIGANSFVAILAITAVTALFYNATQPILDSLSLQLSEKNPKFSYGKLRIAGAAGWAISSIVTGHLVDAISTTVIFLVAATSMLLTFFFALPLKTDKEQKAATDQSYKNVGSLLKEWSLSFMLICVALISAGTSAIWYFYSVYMEENGAPAKLIGYGLSFQGLCELPLFYFSAVILRRFGIKLTLLITILVTTVRLLLYSAVKNPYWAIPIELTHGISWSLFWVVCVEYVNSLVPEERRATGQSLLNAAYYGVGIIVGNFWTGYLSDSKMKVAEIFLLNAGIVFAVGLMILIFFRRKTTT